MEVTKIPKKRVIRLDPQSHILVDKKKYDQKRVAAYCRVSTDSAEQLTSYENQKRVYTDMIARRPDWRMAGIYADAGISGTRAELRPEFSRMISDCKDGKIDYIVTKSISRFARNTCDCLNYVHMLKSMGIGVYFEEQGIDTLTTDTDILTSLFASIAQAESESMSKNITWSYRKRFKEGNPVYVYSKLLGYRKGADGKPEIVPEEAAIVERIFDMYLSGKTIAAISDELRAENIRIPGKEITFGKSMIKNLLRNEKYCGDCIMQKTYTVDCIAKIRKKNEGEVPMYIVENSHPAIISREQFNRAQEEISRRNARTPQSSKTAITATGRYSKYALTDVLVCGECGSRYKRCTWTSRGRKRIVWRCMNRLDYGKKYCKESPTLEEEDLQEAVVRAVNRFNEEDAATYQMLMKATISEAIGLGGGRDETTLLEQRIEALNNEMLQIVNESLANGGEIDDHDAEFKEIHDQIEQLKRRITAIKEMELYQGEKEERVKQLQKIIDDREKNKFQYDDSIVRQMVECIKVYKEGKIKVIFGGGYEVEEQV